MSPCRDVSGASVEVEGSVGVAEAISERGVEVEAAGCARAKRGLSAGEGEETSETGELVARIKGAGGEGPLTNESWRDRPGGQTGIDLFGQITTETHRRGKGARVDVRDTSHRSL